METELEIKFKEKLYAHVKDSYELVSEYTGYKDYFMLLHTKCGHRFSINSDKFFNRTQRCPKCNGSYKENSKKNMSNFIKRNY
jgi:hypothetical protein